MNHWRSPERVRERCDYIREMHRNGHCLTGGPYLKEIALKVFERFGNPETGKPMDHTTVMHHIHGWCREGEAFRR